MRTDIDRNELLFDTQTLERVVEEYGKNEFEIKLNVDTQATAYEIRTAIRYWFDMGQNHRTSARIWDACDAFDSGEWELSDTNEIVYA